MFGRDFSAQTDPNSPIPAAMRLTGAEIDRRLLNPLYFLNIFARWRWHRSERLLAKTISEIVAEKRKKLAAEQAGEVEPGTHDLLDLLLLARDPETGEVLDDVDLYSAFITFFFAGHDTTAHTIAWVCHLLSTNAEAESKLLAELQEVLGDRDTPTYSDLGRLKYLQNIIKETLRLYPPVPQVSRRVAADFEITGPGGEVYRLCKGQTIQLQFASMHYNPSYWTDPMAFNPDRFNEQNSVGRHTHVWAPFSLGERNCVGMNFAMVEIKMVVAMLYRRLRFRPDRLRLPTLRAQTTQAPANGVWLFVEPRVHTSS
jgi:cytochrome P450